MLKRKLLRIPDFDYARAGYYLVTVCTHGRRCILSRIEYDEVLLRPAGRIVARQIEQLPGRFEHVGVDTFVVMPNHVHLVVVLDTRARQASPLRLGTVVAAFKSGSAREIGATVWQRGYHDHIVRDEDDLERIREYVATNPIRWALDPENPA